jgi:hypothetical protein
MDTLERCIVMAVETLLRTLVIASLIVSANMLAYAISRAIRGSYMRFRVRPPFSSTYISVLALITGLIYLGVYALKDDYVHDYNAFIRPLAVILALDLALIIWSARRSIRVSPRGLEVQYIVKKDRIIPWKEVRSIGRDVMSGTLIVHTHYGRKLAFADSWDNLDYMWEVAESKRIKLVRISPTRLGHADRYAHEGDNSTNNA